LWKGLKMMKGGVGGKKFVRKGSLPNNDWDSRGRESKAKIL